MNNTNMTAQNETEQNIRHSRKGQIFLTLYGLASFLPLATVCLLTIVGHNMR